MGLALVALACVTSAGAQEARTLQVVTGASTSHDSNVFRLPGDVDPESAGRPGRSDTINSAYVGLRLDKPYSLQRFQLDVTQAAYRYDKFTHLDYDPLSYRGAWLWHLTPWVSGVLSADHAESAVSFSDSRGFQRNLSTVDNLTFNLDAQLHSGSRFLAGVATTEQASSITVLAEADFEQTSAHIGWRYVGGRGSFFAFTQRFAEGNYTNRELVPGSTADTGFEETQSDFQLSWVATGRSTLGGRLTWINRQHPNLPLRDYAVWVGDLSYAWTPTAKLQIALQAARDVSASSDPFARYTTRDSVSIAPVWQAAAKVSVRASLAGYQTDYGNGTVLTVGREEETLVGELALTWAATRNISLDASVVHEERTANLPFFGYTATVGRLGLSLVF